ncbi:MAG: Clp protease N-terminal domain-containing protein [Planctomycetota bacterium]
MENSDFFGFGLEKYFSISNEYRHYTRRARLIMVLADQYSAANGSSLIQDIHILRALASLDRSIGLYALSELGADCLKLLPEIVLLDGSKNKLSSKDRELDKNGRIVIEAAKVASQKRGSKYIASEHIAIGLLADGTRTHTFLSKYGVTDELLESKIDDLLHPGKKKGR